MTLESHFVSRLMNNRRVCDRVHGEVLLSELAGSICRTDAFQRLDQIRQLGGCAFVYPSATHTRREHSIGVSHLARSVGELLKASYPDRLNDDDLLALELAGLLHDVGHGPFSHLFEEFASELQPEWSHETMSLLIIDYIVSDPVIRDRFQESLKESQVDQCVETIKCMIKGIEEWEEIPACTGRDEKKRFIFEIVHSTTHGIDVDKLDYLQRDNLCVFGRTNACSLSRILSSIRILENRIAFDESVSFEICELYSLRARMHRQVYQHRAVLVAEGLLKDFIRCIDRETGFILSCIQDVQKYIMLTEYTLLAPGGFTNECERIRLFLNERPWYKRVPLTISLNTKPRCGSCNASVDVMDFACSVCGDTGPRKGCKDEHGRMMAVEKTWTAEDLSELLCAKIYMSDVRFGPASIKTDSYNQSWITYESVDKIPFCDKTAKRLVDGKDVAWKPQQTNEILVHSYLPRDCSDDEISSAVERIKEWGEKVGTVSHT